MFAFLSRRLQLWLLLAIGAPLLAWLLGFIGRRVERWTGSTKITRTLGRSSGWLRRRTRGPLAHDR